MSSQPKAGSTFEDWLAAERQNLGEKTQFVRGEIFAMAGGSEAHSLIAMNVGAELRSQFKGSPCYVFTSDMKIRVKSADMGTYPDVSVVCGEREYHDDRRDIITNPNLIIEILSDATEAYDRGDKFAGYRQLASLQTYLLISQHRVLAELFVRQADGSWVLTSFEGLEDQIELLSVGAKLSLAEVYDKVEFTDAVARQIPLP